MTNTIICHGCNTPFIKKHKVQKYCSVPCSSKHISQSTAARRKMRIQRKCNHCLITFEVCPSDSKKFCSHSCAALHHSKRPNVVINLASCATCGKEMSRRKTLAQTRHCSLDCWRSSKKQELIDKWKTGKHPGFINDKNRSVCLWVKNYLRQKHNNACELCRWSMVHSKTGIVPLQIHHIDGNAENNAESNLQLLCPNCHALTDTFGAGNKGNGKRNRRDSNN